MKEFEITQAKVIDVLHTIHLDVLIEGEHYPIFVEVHPINIIVTYRSVKTSNLKYFHKYSDDERMVHAQIIQQKLIEQFKTKSKVTIQ